MTKSLLPTGAYVVAVSGGVDSVVMLDMLAKSHSGELVVAHFDHGIRDDSADDAAFVQKLAEKYGLKFETKREDLGTGASEGLARIRRYAFLRQIAKKHSAKIVTAHHADDIVETIAINIVRGTGWRGVAVLDSADIVRPILDMQKHELLAYADRHTLKWRDDSTNQSDVYLRNRLRRKILDALDEDDRRLLVAMRHQQIEFKRLIDDEALKLAGSSPYSRHFLTQIGETAALEIIRALIIDSGGMSPTQPQQKKALVAIKVAKPDAILDVGGGATLRFTRTQFVVEVSQK